MNRKEKESSVTRELLSVIDEQHDVTQRHLAERLGVALGLANSYLKRCVKKGFIKIQAVPANRYLYYLTPKGFAEKARLSAQYLSYSLDFYRQAGQSCRQAMSEMAADGYRQIVLHTVSDLAEIASIRALEAGVEVIAVFDTETAKDSFLGKPVWKDWSKIEEGVGVLVTDIQTPSETYAAIIEHIEAERVYMPDIISGTQS